MGTTRSLIRWVIVGRPDGLRAALRRQTGCMTWVDRRRGEAERPWAEPAEAPAAAPLEREAGPAPGDDRIPLVPVDEVPPGTVIEVVAGDRSLAVANVDGELIVVDGTCPHAGGPLGDGHLEGCTLTCPWHGWSYDLRTGRSLVAQDVCLQRYDAEVVDGVLVLAPEALEAAADAARPG
ncbi:MAG: Rieske 2Fe-2S domain-containing protein [Myxococcota bacterium]